jgi:hypothetical protein
LHSTKWALSGCEEPIAQTTRLTIAHVEETEVAISTTTVAAPATAFKMLREVFEILKQVYQFICPVTNIPVSNHQLGSVAVPGWCAASASEVKTPSLNEATAVQPSLPAL